MLESAYLTLVDLFTSLLPETVAVAAVFLLIALLIAWVLESIDALIGHRLDRLGIRPRTYSGLLGILAAPLLHSGFGHLAANTVPLFILGCLIAFSDPEVLLLVTIMGWILSGFGAWLLGSSKSRHLGASGLVFAYFGFLLAFGVTRQSPLAIAIAAVAVVLYGGMIWGLVPFREGRSWQSHFFGFASGVACAVFLVPLRDSMAADALQAAGQL
ncbi:MAG: rhomboid family intramembrane serine protease [Xanthomonadales bacterium]|nr:rhomboid family intramembrane serine protease [Xanthomonadales bacterium]